MNAHRLRLAPLLFFLLSLAATPDAYAATYVVRPDGTGDYATIQEAIDAAVNGDVIELTDGTFRGAGNRNIDYRGKAVTVRSRAGDPAVCVIDCEGTPDTSNRGFLFVSDEGPDSILEGVTVTGSDVLWPDEEGAILCDSTSSTIRNCVISGNRTNGLRCVVASPTILGCTFTDNLGSLGGGAICNGGSPLVERCTFRENRSGYGGGGVGCWDGSAAIFRFCVFTGNLSSDFGGGMICSQSSPLISNCTFFNNWAGHGGGGIYFVGSTATVENTLIVSNYDGGAECSNATSAFNCCGFFDNDPGNCSLGEGNIFLDPIFCNEVDLSLRSDSPYLPWNNACGVLIGAVGPGCYVPADVPSEEAGHPSMGLEIADLAPNPAAGSVSFRLILDREGPVRVRVLDVAGKVIATLLDQWLPMGSHRALWDPAREDGGRLPSGIYFVRLEMGHDTATRMVVRTR